ncbi:hypothetical protein NV379_02430 [Paenibacillus sp. N1-5-1-14]|uniref:hypothetical protein n=1 Tax=Paenibacillus radicibacter TaxID=2972488 RepID=UPI002159269C|nr:hypothetical protein [Paenibacillus radicibacter]MCR8641504.1 hypothetical protein [Paenibacillus radicibacter]
MKETWVIVNSKGEYLKKVLNAFTQEYTTDKFQALQYEDKSSALNECDVFESPKLITI